MSAGAPPSLPFPFPTGWFHAADSEELAAGAALPASLLGRELVLFRTASGAAAALDAHCPHMGAHLGCGRVVGETVRCAFHGWRFSGSGACEEIPFGSLDRAKAGTKAWLVRELNGAVFVHHGAAGAPPEYEIPALPEHGSADWTVCERRRWTARARVWDPHENVVDAAHFLQLHGHPDAPRTETSAEGAVFRARSRVKMRAPGGGLVDGTLDWESHGLGYGVMRIAGNAPVTFAVTTTPLDAERLDYRFTFWRRREGPAALAEAVVRDVCGQIEQDLPIWERRAYRAAPLLSPEERSIADFRRWARRFLEKTPGGAPESW